jgi:UDP:flavonoid glycosyltransferase YjiC (YdhE family)
MSHDDISAGRSWRSFVLVYQWINLLISYYVFPCSSWMIAPGTPSDRTLGVKFNLQGGDLDRSPRYDPTFDVTHKKVLFVSLAIRGHATPLLRIAEEMVRRGYNVSFATHDSGQDWVKRTGANFISAGPFPISADVLRENLQEITRDPSIFRGILKMFNDIYVPAAEPMYEALYPVVSASPPDIVIVDIASIGGHDLVHKLQLPYIINSPSILLDMGHNPSYVPAWGTGFSIHMSLWNRCMNLFFPRLLSVALTPPFMQVNKARRERQLPPYRSQHDVYKGARVLVNSAFGFEYARPLSPLVDMIGPIVPSEFFNFSHSTTATHDNTSHHHKSHLLPLLREWTMESSDHPLEGVIYINFGTLSYFESWQAQAILEGLSLINTNMKQSSPPPATSRENEEMDDLHSPPSSSFGVVWCMPNDQRTTLPNVLPPAIRIKIVGSGFPHINVLAHPSVKLGMIVRNILCINRNT